jgi:hypothetical protein
LKGLQTLRDILLIELQRGASAISREHVHQATDYVEDLLKCGHLDGPSWIRAFVVGHRADEKVEPSRTIGQNPVRARIDVVTYSQLVRTGEKRLLSLRERLKSRYEEMGASDLLRKTSIDGGRQRPLPLSGTPT